LKLYRGRRSLALIPVKTKTLAVNASPRLSLSESSSRTLTVMALVTALVACCPVQMRADRIALHFTANGEGADRTYGNHEN